MICCNFRSIRDAIGAYAANIYDQFSVSPDVEEITCENADTAGMSRLGWIFSTGMTKAMLRAAKQIGPRGITHVMIEYPFQEYNPAIIPAFGRIASECRKNGAKVCLSVHEYLRAKKMRRKVVECFAKKSDLVFVSDKETKEALQPFADRIVIRSITAGVFPHGDVDIYGKSEDFLYFGLVNRSKAFAEMLEAWKLFNADGKHRLRILTSSDVSGYEPFGDGITVYKDLSNEQAAGHFMECSYAIVPVLPSVFAGNTSFKSAAAFGCICIGKFGDDFPAPGFAVPAAGYEAEVFAEALRKADGLPEEDKMRRMKEAVEFGALYRPERTAEAILKELT